MTERAYSTSDPATVRAFRETCERIAEIKNRAMESAMALGGNKGLWVAGGPFAGDRIVALIRDDAVSTPEGWRHVRGRLEPRLGRPGEAARAWLEEHRLPDLRAVLVEHGLPLYCRVGGLIYRPKVFLYGSTLWALYPAEPDSGCAWEPRRLSEYHAAWEATDRPLTVGHGSPTGAA